MKKDEIIEVFAKACKEMSEAAAKTPESEFYLPLNSKWSVAENLKHLSLSSKLFARALNVPKIGLMFKLGRTFKKSISYDALVEKYLEAQPPADTITGFEPKFKENTSKQIELDEFENQNNAIILALSKWNEFQISTYVIPHPLMGKLSLREFLYFMIYHTKHHTVSVGKS